MAIFRIEGGHHLEGEITISGSKNATLPLMVAATMAHGPVELTNVPDISDVAAMAEIIKSIGGRVEGLGSDKLIIDGTNINQTTIDPEMAHKLRASILLMGMFAGRFKEFSLPYPGGDLIGRRPVNVHLDAMKALGFMIDQTDHGFSGRAIQPTGAEIFLDQVSVTGTENAILAAVLTPGKTIIRPAATEPHVINLCDLLVAMGASIEGINSDNLTVNGVDQLKPASIRVVGDEIETGTYAVAAAMTQGRLTLLNAPADMEPIVHPLRQMGLNIDNRNNIVSIDARSLFVRPISLQVRNWPGVPTDIQPPLTVLATQAHGDSTIHDWMYENRLNYTKDLGRLGADIELKNPHQALVHGPTRLVGAAVDSPDIRAGIAFVLAGLGARGITNISNVEHIKRGYGHLVHNLTSVGAVIEELEN